MEPAANQSEVTAATYRQYAQKYVESTPKVVEGAMRTWLDASVHGLNLDAHIFEVGSGSGRDADYLEAAGFTVQRSDLTEEFVVHLRQQGHKAQLFNALTDSYPQQQDLIFADAVLVHFNQEESEQFLRKAYDALKPEGRLAFTAKTSPEYTEEVQSRLGGPRWFYNWPVEQFQKIVEQHGFVLIYQDISVGLTSSGTWVNRVFTKSS